MVRCGCKNGHRKDIILEEIRLCVQNILLTIIGSIVNIIGGGGRGDLYDHLISLRILTLTINKIFIGAPKFMTKIATDKI